MRAACVRQPGLGVTRRTVLFRRLLSAVVLLVAAVLAGSSCGGSGAAGCGRSTDAVFWGGTQWFELAKGLAANAADCVEYYVSVPPKDADHTRLRGPGEFSRIRDLGQNFHPVAEIRFTGDAGWQQWVSAKPGRTYYGAGVEARRRMAQAGLDVHAGDTWVVNELDEEILAGSAERRREMIDFLRGLHDGASGMPPAKGILFNIGPFSDMGSAEPYKSKLQQWLTDSAFWSALDRYVAIFADEVYATPANWGVRDLGLDERAQALDEFFYHVPRLAGTSPGAVTDRARAFLRGAFVPLVNAAWPHEGLGQTNRISADLMARFVSTQVYAMRKHAQNDGAGAGSRGIGFAWAPNSAEPSYTEAGRDAVLERLTIAVRDSATGAARDACGSDGQNEWCNGDVDGASANDVWKAFSAWN
jgi:hypothetical protein